MKTQVIAARTQLAKQIANAGNTIIKGDATFGYYGRILSTKFITPQALNTLVGLTAGEADNLLTANWLKFSVNGKVVYVCDRIIRRNARYSALNSAGILSGKTVTILGKQYKARSMKTGASNTTPALNASEWNKLMYPICANRPAGATLVWDNLLWADIASTAVGAGETFGSEQFPAGGGVYLAVSRGAKSIDSFNSLGVTNDYLYTYAGWRPVLEALV